MLAVRIENVASVEEERSEVLKDTREKLGGRDLYLVLKWKEQLTLNIPTCCVFLNLILNPSASSNSPQPP